MLVPGTQGGAGGITPVARDIVRRVPRTQVWIVDRREQALEDTSVFRSGDPRRGAGLLPRLQVQARARRRTRSSSPNWGLRLQLDDLRSVVRRAGSGRPARDPRRPLGGRLDGGGVRGVGLRRAPRLPRDRRAGADRRRPARAASPRPTSQRAKARAGRHPHRQGLPRPARHRASPRSAASSPRSARCGRTSAPTSPRRCRSSRCCRTSSSRRCRVTNEARVRLRLRRRPRRPKALELIHIRAGRLADSGDPRGWQDGELTPIRRFARPTRATSRTRPSGTTRAACCSTSTRPAR